MLMDLLKGLESRRKRRKSKRVTPTIAKVYRTERGYFVNLVAKPRKKKGRALKVVRIRI